MIKAKYDHYGKKLEIGDYVLYASHVWSAGNRAEVEVGKILSFKSGMINIQGASRGIRSTDRVRKVSARFAKEWQTGSLLNA